MDVRQLEIFVAVADDLHFARAAERLQLAPSAVSQQVSRLERQLGGRLFDRNSRTVRLTPAGQVLQSEAKIVLAAVSRAQSETRLALRATTTTMRVGYASSGHGSLVLPAVMAYGNAVPRLHIDVHELPSAQIVSAVATGDLDAGFAWQSEGPSILRHLQVAQRPFVVLMPPDHPLALSPIVAVDQLRNDTFVLERRDNNPRLYDHIVAALGAEGVRPRIRRHVGQVATMTAAIKAGDGLGVATDDGLDVEIDGGVVSVPLDIPAASLHLFWCASTDSRPLANFVSHMAAFGDNVGVGVPSDGGSCGGRLPDPKPMYRSG